MFGATAPMFTVTGVGVPSPTVRRLTDQQILALNITQGSGKTSGLSVSTMSVKFKGQSPPAGAPLESAASVSFTSHALARLTALCGQAPALARDPQMRWTGRIASQTVEDRAPARQGRPPRRVSTVTGVDWFGLASEVGESSVVINAGRNYFPAVLGKFVETLGFGISDSPEIRGFADWCYFNVPGLKVSKYLELVEGIGSLIAMTRAGGPMQTQLDWWRSYESTYTDRTPVAVSRWHAQTPVEWTQPTTLPKSITTSWYRAGDQTIRTETQRAGYPLPGGQWPNTTIDLTYLSFTTEGEAILRSAVAGKLHQSVTTGYRLESLTFDLLHLLERNGPGDRLLVLQLLCMEIGDGVPIAADWPIELSGMYFATQLDWTISPDEFTVTLAIVPYVQLTGEASTVIDEGLWGTWNPPNATWADIPYYEQWKD